ncbi:ImmA/IrrE family metallo-endopeptidase [Hymenobacter sp. DH14]|uniref:ImmA/IrrE family metallo-endopeptidase n=1 Tax=Hymenobacter cyanobacteriorum TaxID=2926463 RepID=A0A9X1VKL6_9BACT|nr:ImmA/IrrE family metallo-endopeptidase [Hymenobacter cyanobacteriorum]MCI1189887.1 ImmA/IrrE family metallo-endopeptidase [Hymenobacter cyanobacteriorum]
MSHKFPPRFKTEAEATALNLRRQLGLTVEHACPARQVTGLYGITVTAAGTLEREIILDALRAEFPDQVRVRQQLALVANATTEFSAIVAIVRDHKMILYNGNNSPARQESDIMHEVAHILRGHKGDCLQLNADISLRVHNEDHEQEAKWLGATLQIPEEGILRHVCAGRTSEEIAAIYGASVQMANYRRRILGIDIRAARRKRF